MGSDLQRFTLVLIVTTRAALYKISSAERSFALINGEQMEKVKEFIGVLDALLSSNLALGCQILPLFALSG